MRIQLIASGDLWAGAEAMVMHLAAGLQDQAGVELRVVLLNRHRLAQELVNSGIDVRVVEETTQSFTAICTQVKRLVDEFSPDIIHSHRYKENVIAWLARRGRHRCRLVATQHGMPERSRAGLKGIPARLRTQVFMRLLAGTFARTVLVSEEMHRALVGRYSFREQDLAVIHNGLALPAEVLRPRRARLVVGSAGRLFPIKDFNLLVEAAGLVVRQSDQIDFVIAGEGPERGKLEARLRQLKIPAERFRLLGHQDDMHRFYRGIDVYVNTSLHEGIPMSILEAMATGLPVVAPEVGGIPEIIEQGRSGILVPDRSPASFARSLLRFTDMERVTVMGQAARQRVEDDFSQEAMVRRYLALYQELLSVP